MIERISLLRNVGQFDSVSAGANLNLSNLSLIYAENGRGKTTLATIIRSMSTGDATLLQDRHRLGATHPPHVVINLTGSTNVFQNGSWSSINSDVVIFDDDFVAENVCSGLKIESTHRQNLHELILGSRGVNLNQSLMTAVESIENHNRELRVKELAIPLQYRGGLNLDEFCALTADEEIDQKIQSATKVLAAAQSSVVLNDRNNFSVLSLPEFDLAKISSILSRTLSDLEANSAQRVREHFQNYDSSAEEWALQGVVLISQNGQMNAQQPCPFCAKDLVNSNILEHYQAFFGQTYQALRQEIQLAIAELITNSSGTSQANFERNVRVVIQDREFWKDYIELEEIQIDTTDISQKWALASEAVLTLLGRKQAAPLEPIEFDANISRIIEDYETARLTLLRLNSFLEAANQQIAQVKLLSANADISTLRTDLSRLNAIKARHSLPLITAADAYISEKSAKTRAEAQRDVARAALNHYRATVFPVYEQSINNYLKRFNAEFRIGSVTAVNNRGGSSTNYNILINNIPVDPANSDGGPSFRTTLSAGDRNTLALAFFFASLEQDPNIANKIVVIDDPMTSLDEHRTVRTVSEVRNLATRVQQVLVLSHSKPFLCNIWESADTLNRSALRIVRAANGSDIQIWDVNQDCITEHDKRYALVDSYIQASDPNAEREVAQALRPILESYMRVAYPILYPPGTLLGPFIGICRQRIGQPNEVLSAQNLTELEELKDYANRYHHDSNPAWRTQTINDQELVSFAQRTLSFIS